MKLSSITGIASITAAHSKNNVAFGRIIKLRTVGTPNSQKIPDTAQEELWNVLNSRSNSIYTTKNVQAIRGFFKDVLGDYDGKKGIDFLSTQDGTYILSGIDRDTYKQAAARSERRVKEVLSNSRKPKKEKQKEVEIIKEEPERYLQKRLENGQDGKRDTEITLVFDKNRGKIKKLANIKYYSLNAANSYVSDGVAFYDPGALAYYKKRTDINFAVQKTKVAYCDYREAAV